MMVHSLLVAGSILLSGVLCSGPFASEEPSPQVPSSQQLLEMAVAEMTAEGLGTDPLFDLYNGFGALIAVGCFDEAFGLLSRSENELQRKIDAALYVSGIVRFRADDQLEDVRLKALLQPQEIAEYRVSGLIRRGDLDDAETQLKALSADYPFLFVLIDEHFRIVERRIRDEQPEAIEKSLRLTVECLSLQSRRKPRLYLWSKQLERGSELVVRHQVPELIPELLANAEVACELLKGDKSYPEEQAEYHSCLAAIFFYCGAQDRADEQLRIASNLLDRSMEEVTKEIVSEPFSSGRRRLNISSVLETTGRITALLAKTGSMEEARARIERTKTQVKSIDPDTNIHNGQSIIKMLLQYGAWEIAEEFISAASLSYWRCLFQLKLCEQLAQQNHREEAILRLKKVIPEFTGEAEFVNRVGLQSDALRLLVTLDEKEISSQLLQEILVAYEGDQDPRDLQNLFQLLINIRDYTNAWKLFRERELAASKAMNLTTMGLSLHDFEIAALRKK